MAHIRKLPSGKWQATVYVSSSKRITATRLLIGDARAWAREQETTIARGEWRDPRLARTTFEAWFERWWSARVLEPETVTGQRSTAENHVLPHWRGWPLGGIGRIEVQGWAAKLQREGVGPQTIIKAYGILRACLNAAVDEDLIGRSPCRNITLPTAPKAPPRFFTVEQVNTLVAELRKPHATVALVMAWTGLRWEEVAGLEVGHVRSLRRELVVAQVVTRTRRIKPYAKSDAGNRTVPAPAHVLEALAPYWQAAKDAAPLVAGEGRRAAEHRLLFRQQDLTLHYPAWWEAWQAAHRRLGKRGVEVPGFSPHALRHTAASWWVQNGVPIYDVQHLLGHGRIESTAIYAHLAPGVHRGVREAWDVLLGEESGSESRKA